jgi:hypothetical protein
MIAALHVPAETGIAGSVLKIKENPGVNRGNVIECAGTWDFLCFSLWRRPPTRHAMLCKD